MAAIEWAHICSDAIIGRDGELSLIRIFDRAIGLVPFWIPRLSVATNIHLEAGDKLIVTLTLYAPDGKTLKATHNTYVEAGEKIAPGDGTAHDSGVYVLRLFEFVHCEKIGVYSFGILFDNIVVYSFPLLVKEPQPGADHPAA